MKRAILLITSRMDEPNIDLTLNTVAEQAIASKVRVFVWFVDADLYFNTPSATAFKALALQTGGDYLAFSGVEPFPDPEILLCTIAPFIFPQLQLHTDDQRGTYARRTNNNACRGDYFGKQIIQRGCAATQPDPGHAAGTNCPPGPGG